MPPRRAAVFALLPLLLIAATPGCLWPPARSPQPSSPPAKQGQHQGRPAPLKMLPYEGMVSVPTGTLIRGSKPGNGEHDELPLREVFVPAFHIDRTEVTVASYRRCVEAAACSAEGVSRIQWRGTAATPSPLCNYPHPTRGDHPMNCVSWPQASRFCAWVGKRLPGEMEWERAARGDDERRFPWGDSPPGPGTRMANLADEAGLKKYPNWKIFQGYDDGYAETAPVASFPDGASPFGALDMAGNVWEWVRDWYGDRSYQVVGQELTGPGYGELRVARGGSFESQPALVRTSERFAMRPADRAYFLGFRCAADSPPP